jgi:DNA helicase-2/ATP-dependent DNA helicase PcrA
MNTEPLVSTFHALGARILRDNAQKLGLSRYFSILDRDESISLIKEALREAGINEKNFEPRKVLNAISRQKGDGISLTDYQEKCGKEFFPKTIAKAWFCYNELLAKQKALDFDDLLIKTYELLVNNPDILLSYQNRWRYICVDEYQDTNTIQYKLTKLLAAKYRNLCVVGDMDQSIYGWRGADFSNLLNFEQDYPDAKVILLEENYRSTKIILTAANEIIKKNRNRRDKNLFTKQEGGEKITIMSGLNESDEAAFIAIQARDLIEDGVKPEEIAILYRANFQSRAIEEACLREGIPYQVVGTRFFERKEIKDIIAFIKAALNPNDFESIKRVINIPARGIGKATLMKMAAGAEDSLPLKTRAKIKDFRKFLAQVKKKSETSKPSELIKYILQASGVETELKNGGEEGLERLENIREFVTLAVRYDNMPAEEALLNLITEASLTSDQDDMMVKKKEGVRLMTVHASKGLEFDYVFITGLEQDLFPHQDIGGGERDLEEERRLFYVALTRARKKLFLTYAQTRTIFGSRQVNMPSEFIFDISDELVEIQDSLGGENEKWIEF